VERGMALVVVMMAMVLLGAMGAGLVLTTSSEVLVSWNFRGSHQALYAAEAAAEFAIVDLASVVPDWPTLLDGSVKSWFVDGVASGNRALPDGTMLDITAVVERNASWRPYAFGPLKALLPVRDAGVPAPSAFYVMVFVAADPDSSSRLKVRAEAFGPRGAHKTVDVGLTRGEAGVQLESWAEVR
jgi:hypothetical protein